MNDILKFTALSFTFILFAFRVSFAQVNQEWAATYRALGAGSDFANSVAVDFSGNVYVTGKSKTEFLTIKYNASGAEQWVVRYGKITFPLVCKFQIRICRRSPIALI